MNQPLHPLDSVSLGYLWVWHCIFVGNCRKWAHHGPSTTGARTRRSPGLVWQDCVPKNFIVASNLVAQSGLRLLAKLLKLPRTAKGQPTFSNTELQRSYRDILPTTRQRMAKVHLLPRSLTWRDLTKERSYIYISSVCGYC